MKLRIHNSSILICEHQVNFVVQNLLMLFLLEKLFSLTDIEMTTCITSIFLLERDPFVSIG